MNFQFAFVVTVSLLCHVNCENVNLAKFDERAIINGYNAPDRPFYVKINMTHKSPPGTWSICGGTIIGTQHVLTAAHCFHEDGTNIPYDFERIDVFVGDMSQPNYEQTVTTLSGVPTVNPGYNGQYEQGYDVAVVKLNQSVGSGRILRMCKSDESFAQRYSIAVCGFGETVPESWESSPKQLQETHVQETGTSHSCGKDPMFNRDLQICLGSIPGRSYSGSCQGDSGGPAFPLDNYYHEPICLYGTVSFGATPYPTCDGDNVFSRVSAYYDWIQKQLYKED